MDIEVEVENEEEQVKLELSIQKAISAVKGVTNVDTQDYDGFEFDDKDKE